LTDVIVRQTNDLRRIVDEFSRFARMPEPDRRPTIWCRWCADAVTLQEGLGRKACASPPTCLRARWWPIDATMIGQALTNLIKNAGEAIETLREKGAPDGYVPRDRGARGHDLDAGGILTIADNGIGLPEDRARLFEPYVTTRDKGTGLGLPIVKKIIEEHGGTLALVDAPPSTPGGHVGCAAEIRLPPRSSCDRRQQNKGEDKHMSDILIVDDERDIRELVADILQDEGYTTRTAANSDECLAASTRRAAGADDPGSSGSRTAGWTASTS
jgi:two-component system, NtrC family, nitrogen regulation sensor histidine kinase NtrY